MGVRGLTTFMAQYEDKYKEKVFLRNCPVVIDGCNLMYFLYFDGPSAVVKRGESGKSPGTSAKKAVPNAHWFGGDWETYSQNVRYFFQQLRQCEIIPIVLMDGAYETRKISTLKSRFEAVVRDNVRREQFPGKTYTPVFLKTVFLEVIAEQKIPCYQTMGEADCTIAYVAHLLGDCYILSSDSDFMVYINSKAILLKSLKFAKAAVGKSVLQSEENNAVEVKANGSPTKVWTLQAQFVSIHRLCDEEFQMRDRRLLPLAAVILGNDYIHAKAFKSFQALKANGNTHTSSGRIESIMKWLGRKQSVQVGIDALIRLVEESKKDITVNSINKIVSMYEGMDGERRVWTTLKGDLDLSKWMNEEEKKLENGSNGTSEGESRLDNAKDEVTDEELEHLMRATASALLGDESIDLYKKANFEQKLAKLEAKICDSVLPSWFLEGHTTCEFQSYLLNLYKNHLVIFNPQVEWFEDDSCHELSVPIISVTAGILLCDEAYKFYVLTRMKGRMEIKTLCPLTKLPIFGEVPKLFEGTVLNAEFKKQLTYEKKLALISETLFGDNSEARNYVQSWPASYRIWVACLLHYVLKKGGSKTLKKRETLAISCSIFLCVFKNLFVNPSEQKSKASSTAKDDNPNLTLFQQAIKESGDKLKCVRSFYQNFENFSEVTGKKFMKTYDMRISYALSEYLCSVFHTEMLNGLIDKPYKSPKVRCTINNFFMYNLSEALIDKAIASDDEVKEFPSVFTSNFCKVSEMSPMIQDFVNICVKFLEM